jgi:lipoyl(octanoyl) transferase
MSRVADSPIDEIQANWLGTSDYGSALELQRSTMDRRKSDSIPDTILLLEHPHVITLGRRADNSSRN